MITKYKDFLLENNNVNNFFIQYDKDEFVYHITSSKIAERIKEVGFKTGQELGVAEKRSAIYFADKTVNYGIYARNQEGETYDGDDVGEVKVNLKGLKLLNMNYKENGVFVNHKKYNTLVVRGELEKIPFDIDGTISYLDGGRIYEVALFKNVANKLI